MNNFLRKHRVKVVVVLLIALAVAALLFWSNSSNEGQIKEVRSNTPIREPSIKTFEGNHISFEHKGTYRANTLEAKNDDLELALLSASTNYEKKLSVAVSRLSGGNLQNHSAYKLRQSDPAKYTSSTQQVAGTISQIWTKNDGSEITVFVTKAEQVAVLAFSTAGNQDDLRLEVQELLKTFRWNQ